MFADLKQKAAGLDRKRVYTAVAALMIAGAAGHFMQRSTNAAETKAPGAAPVAASAAMIAPLPSAPAETEQAAVADTVANPAPDVLEPAPEELEAAAELAPQAAEEPEIAATDVVEPVADVAAASPEPAMPDRVLSEGSVPDMFAAQNASVADVTRSASIPNTIFAATDPASIDRIAAVDMAPEAQVAPADEAQPVTLAAAEDLGDMASEPTPPLPSCDITFEAVADMAAQVAISVNAPCNSGEGATFDHAGMTFSEQLGPDGDLSFLAPAMAEDAIFTLTTADGQVVTAQVQVPDFADYERVALVWKGATGLQLHALEHGASYGEPGHIWADTPATPEAATAGTGGFVSVLGGSAAGYAADVYTFPASLMADGAEPDVSVEAQVMENTCGSEIEGKILRTNPGRAPTMQPLTMIVPGCDAVGEYLVLKNLPQDLKLARTN